MADVKYRSVFSAMKMLFDYSFTSVLYREVISCVDEFIPANSTTFPPLSRWSCLRQVSLAAENLNRAFRSTNMIYLINTNRIKTLE